MKDTLIKKAIRYGCYLDLVKQIVDNITTVINKEYPVTKAFFFLVCLFIVFAMAAWIMQP